MGQFYKLLGIQVVLTILLVGTYLEDVEGGVLGCKSVSDCQKQISDHFAAQKQYDGAGKRIFKTIDEVMEAMKRPYHPNIGFYDPLNPPLTGLTDIRCTKKGLLGCGDRCFTPHKTTRCLNGKVMGSELPFER